MKDLFESSTWVGVAAIGMLVLVSVAAAFWASRRQPSEGSAVRLPPIKNVKIDPGFIGNQAFGFWTLHCENRAAQGEEGKRVCLTNAKTLIAGPGNKPVMAAGFSIVMMNTQPVPGALFILPPAANPAEGASFAIDRNTVFRAPINCLPKQCLVQGALPPEAIEQLRSGHTLTLVYSVKDGAQKDRKVRVDQLLHGFRQSYDAMARAMAS
jgi:invasion protein IalB